MQAQRVHGHTAVHATAGKVALKRGPIVYCLEGVDHAAPITAITLDPSAELEERNDPRTGLVSIHAPAILDDLSSPDAPLYSTTPRATSNTTLTAVPYYSWANRGSTDMTVWIRTNTGQS